MEIFHLLGGGLTDEELSEELAELVQRVQQTSKAGQISLTIKVVPASDTTVELIDKITVRKPEFKREPHEFQVGEGGESHRRWSAVDYLDESRRRTLCTDRGRRC